MKCTETSLKGLSFDLQATARSAPDREREINNLVRIIVFDI